MSREAIIIFLGVLVALMPVWGFPRSWEEIATSVLGCLVVLIGFFAWRGKSVSSESEVYVENAAPRQPVQSYYPEQYADQQETRVE